MRESRLTVSPEMMEQMWQGYRCAACLEPQDEAFPVRCAAVWCGFPMRAEQRRRLEQDFVGEVEQMKREGWVEREQARLEEEFFIPKSQISVRRKP
jgi:hypothetical protein